MILPQPPGIFGRHIRADVLTVVSAGLSERALTVAVRAVPEPPVPGSTATPILANQSKGMRLMRKLAKAIAVGAVVVPVVLGGATVASADGGPGYGKHDSSATVYGGTSAKTKSGFTEDGTAYFMKSSKTANSTGATGNATGSHS